MKLLYKEIVLSSSPVTFFFILSSLFVFVPGYPILMSAFFTSLGIFYSFQTTRENNDIQYSLLLPVSKTKFVESKFIFALFVEMSSFILITVFTFIRMNFLSEAKIYKTNALMCANFSFLGFALLIFGLFNYIFILGFFKTAYYFGKPFIGFCIAAVILVIIAESLHYFPGTEKLNSFGFENFGYQLCVFFAGLFLFAVLTAVSLKKSKERFIKTDL